MIVKLSGEISEDTVHELIEALNMTPEGDFLDVYISSQGGCMASMRELVDIIDSSEKIAIVTFSRIAYSAALTMLLTLKTHCEVLNGTLGMAHRPFYPSVPVTSDFKLDSSIIPEMKILQTETKKELEALLSLDFFTEKERKDIRKGKELFVGTERLREYRNKLNNKNEQIEQTNS